MDDEDFDEVCVVTHPLAPASENATRTLLEILSTITTVSLVTSGLSDDSRLRDEYEVAELTNEGVGNSILVAAIRFILNQLRMCWVIARRDESVILFFGATSYVLPIAFSRLFGKTVVLEPRGNVPLTLELQWKERVPSVMAIGLARIVWLLERVGYQLAHGIVTYTPAMAEQLDLGPYTHKLYPNGARYIDVTHFQPRTAFDNREVVVGFLGRIDEEKGIRKLATVAKHLPEDITFRFIGDGNLTTWLESELESEIRDGSVEVVGWVDHEGVPEQLSELQLLVMPSHPTEGLPTVILESFACGTPVYATPVSGVPDVVRGDETGFLMRESHPQEVAKNIERIIRSEPLSEMSKTCREVAVKTYSKDGAVDRYRTILCNL
ncbi:group 1 glycosyl transferase [Natrialba chahannaoensis JCM 10990]|uniref:Group 1 glycosyl transferase n=1 Tax=Natrialba chahannaoensis JCM 10990 TaxID=1227492 RepID=M0AE77_9EURY|nr:glycosyltransferase family 4 protein [Natrialba chahannaoensis]ELY96711.1 group 1 glycosyl transferase [Natrialba chahannaoensis JCM 10990]